MKRKKSLLFCIDTLNDGGAEKLLIDILKRIDPDIFDVDLFVLQRHGIYFDAIPDYVNWYTLENHKYNLIKDFDVEIAFLEGMATKYIAYRDTNAVKIAWVHVDLISMHWTMPYFKDREEEMSCYSKMDKIVFVSEQVKDQFNLLFPGITVAQQVIYNFVDKEKILALAKESVLKPGRLTLCSVGRLMPQKGYKRLLRVIKELVVDGYEFDYWIIGEGEERNELEYLIKDKYLLENVFLKGFQENPYSLIAAADIFVLGSHAEGFPLVLCEAICLGKPILATEVSGVSELLNDGEYGLVVQHDTLSIYKGLCKLIEDSSLRYELQRKIQKRSNIFNVDNTMMQIYELLK